jgi:hypothetical protein
VKSQANHQPTQLRQVSIQSREEQGPRLGGAKGDLVAGAQAAGGDPGDEWRLLLEKYGKKRGTKMIKIW